MTVNAYYSGARDAIRLARSCDRDAICNDIVWAIYMKSEARRHRERAAWYLRSRKWQLEDRAVRTELNSNHHQENSSGQYQRRV